ncbi:tetratricopeptide repeat protein [Desulfovibrio sulfodismutans]|uniref:Tetratricopeptide repeat protein n=1 Tax=Desulfolutivibrio sulfodismutans TaxID=63561 RepID=A0A7K3NI72_9BACT|nr:tetratricopeptide repeat protein [Desulfolutivibrio sulfodismutans]NDY55888.1 tetratricopeptide repeat protein [Desulfolutivibrio sulfodismutans]QLA11153.1 tetratricopeptide repeat protein [Desulfolutivibrio sulfodismutans DSM 3696]
MIEKIDLYREVLAIEPNSKAFFPLARALAESGRPDEAMAILETGIGFHPDHLEAKFLLVELYAASDREEDAVRVFSGVQDSLVRYPAVWRLWARHAAFSSRDPIVALSFLAQFFRDPGLTFAGVLEKGLEAMAASPLAAPSPAQPVVEAATPETGSVASSEAAEILEGGTPAPVAEPETAPTPPSAMAAGPANACEPTAEAPAPAAAGLPEEAVPDEEAEMSMPLRGAQEVLELAGALGMAEEDEAPAKEAASLAADMPDAVPAVAQVRTVHIPDMGIRTRTMASLLAAQGDAQGALDIYRELRAHLPSGPERAEVEARIAELSPPGLAAFTQKTVHEPQPVAAPVKPKGKAKLMGLLDALAGRLEARSEA